MLLTREYAGVTNRVVTSRTKKEDRKLFMVFMVAPKIDRVLFY